MTKTEFGSAKTIMGASKNSEQDEARTKNVDAAYD